jgi:putative endonuclease
MLKLWFVYIIECSDGRFYTGVMDNVKHRFQRHKSGQGGSFTNRFGVQRLLYYDTFFDRRDAFRRERQLKGWTRRKKLALIHGELDLLKKL